jgi:hypothetical protein
MCFNPSLHEVSPFNTSLLCPHLILVVLKIRPRGKLKSLMTGVSKFAQKSQWNK